MERANGLDIPRTLEDACDPRRLALLVYDMQGGVVEHVPDPQPTIRNVQAVLSTARCNLARILSYFSGDC